MANYKRKRGPKGRYNTSVGIPTRVYRLLQRAAKKMDTNKHAFIVQAIHEKAQAVIADAQAEKDAAMMAETALVAGVQ
jgi:uncharacterized protein (DUF1778 family)